MDTEKFYNVVLSDYMTCIWISAYVGIFKEPAFGMLEQVRSGLVNDIPDWLTCESVRENIRAYINA